MQKSITNQLYDQASTHFKKIKWVLVFPLIGAGLYSILLYWVAQPVMHIETQAFTQNNVSLSEYVFFMLVLFLIFIIMHLVNGLTVIFAAHAIYPYYQHQPVNMGEVIRKSLIDIPKMVLWIIVNITFGKFIYFCELWSDRWKDTRFAKETLHGNGWYIATFFVVPLILFENKSIWSAIQTSAGMVYQQWGRVNKNQFYLKKKVWISMILFFLLVFILLVFKSIFWIALYLMIVLLVLISAYYFTKFAFLLMAAYLFVKKDKALEGLYETRLFEKVFYLSRR